jgi:hypothetical protein
MSTRIIRGIPAPFAFATLSRIRLVIPRLHSSSSFFWKEKKWRKEKIEKISRKTKK